MKIGIVTLNPGIDRLMYLASPLTAGSMNRAARTVTDQGCKGANQSLVFGKLGDEVEYFSFTGGIGAAFMEDIVQKAGVHAHFVPTGAGVRMNIKVIDAAGACTEINERGGPIKSAEWERLKTEIFAPFHNDIQYDTHCDRYDMLSLCGSIPQGVEKSVYNSLIREARAHKIPTALDCDGEALALGLQAEPALIKPNVRELASLLGESEERLRQRKFLVEACGKIRAHYDTEVLCTLDADGSLFVGNDGVFHIPPVNVPLRGFSGAGDTYLAAFLHARYSEKLPTGEALRFGAAAASAKVALEGTRVPDRAQTEQMLPRVLVEKIG